MTDRTHPDLDEPVSEPDPTASEEGQDTPEDLREHLPATKPTRMRPSALDLERGFDQLMAR